MIPLVIDKDLRLVLQPPKGSRVYDPVPIALETRAVAGLWLRINTAASRTTAHGIAGQKLVLTTFHALNVEELLRHHERYYSRSRHTGSPL